MNKDYLLLGMVTAMSLAANLPQEIIGMSGLDRRLLVIGLLIVLAIALVRYSKVAMVLSVVILAFGANLPQTLAAEVVYASHGVPGCVAIALDHPLDFFRQGFVHDFVRVQEKDPIALGFRECVALLKAVALPIGLEQHRGSHLFGKLPRAVGGPGVHNEDPIRPGDRFERSP